MNATVPHIKLYPSNSDAPRHQIESFFFLSFVSPDNLQIELPFFCLFECFVRQDGVVALKQFHSRFLAVSLEHNCCILGRQPGWRLVSTSCSCAGTNLRLALFLLPPLEREERG